MIKRRPMSQILQLTSIDSIEIVQDFCTVREVLDSFVEEIQESYYLELRDAMIKGDYPPIHVCRGSLAEKDYDIGYEGSGLPKEYRRRLVMCNGHHRVRIAYDLGWNSILTTDKIIESDRY